MLVKEVIESSANRERGFFKYIGSIFSTLRIENMVLCASCWEEHRRIGYLEELCQLHDVLIGLELLIEWEYVEHIRSWWKIEKNPSILSAMSFNDIPWPIRDR